MVAFSLGLPIFMAPSFLQAPAAEWDQMKGQAGPRPLGASQATPIGPKRSKTLLWDAHTGSFTPGPPHIGLGNPQEVAGGDVVVEDHQGQGHNAVVVQGTAGGVVTQVGSDAGHHRDRAVRPALPFQEKGQRPVALSQNAVASGRTEWRVTSWRNEREDPRGGWNWNSGQPLVRDWIDSAAKNQCTAWCPASTKFAECRRLVLPVHLLGRGSAGFGHGGLAAVLVCVSPIAGDVKLRNDRSGGPSAPSPNASRGPEAWRRGSGRPSPPETTTLVVRSQRETTPLTRSTWPCNSLRLR